MSVRSRSIVIVIAVLALSALACDEGVTKNIPISPVPQTVTPDTSLTQTGGGASPTSGPQGPTQMPVCTPLACASGESLICPLAQGCPLGCGVVCGVPSATPAGGPTATTFSAPNVAAPNAEGEGITFHFDPALTPDYKWEIVPADSGQQGAPEAWLLPSHYAFTFPKYPVANTYQPPRILVFPVKNFENFNSEAVSRVAQMKQVLADKPTSFNPQTGIPVIPVFNAAQVFRSHVVYMDFQNGKGIRFITQYDQAPIPINNSELFYVYQGVTNDGLYYVAAFFPLSHPSLPADFSNAATVIGPDFVSYLDKIVATLDAAADNSFTPDLRALDLMMQSLKVK